MIELFEWPPTRSQRARWALEELGFDYTSRKVHLIDQQQDTAAYRAIHPLGVVPALRTNTYTMFESVAIVMQLIDESPDQSLAPEPGTPERALYYQWCVFAGTELDPAIMLVFDNTMRPLEHMRPPGTPRYPSMAEKGRWDFAQRAAILSKELAAHEYIIGDTFTGADILIGHSCFMASFVGLISDYPILQAYHEKLSQRPAYRQAYAITS